MVAGGEEVSLVSVSTRGMFRAHWWRQGGALCHHGASVNVLCIEDNLTTHVQSVT